jgi:hypothetical protein
MNDIIGKSKKKDRIQETEDGGQKAEVRRQRTEDRWQK